MNMRFISCLWGIYEKGVLGLQRFPRGRLVSVLFLLDLNISSGVCFKNTQEHLRTVRFCSTGTDVSERAPK